MSGSDLCADRIIGTDLSTRMGTVWQQGKAKANLLLGKAPPEACTAHESTYRVPYEIVEMIVTHLIHNLDALKACSLTCRSWYITTVPHLHHTLTLRDNISNPTHHGLKPLSKLHELGLVPLRGNTGGPIVGRVSLVCASGIQPP